MGRSPRESAGPLGRVPPSHKGRHPAPSGQTLLPPSVAMAQPGSSAREGVQRPLYCHLGRGRLTTDPKVRCAPCRRHPPHRAHNRHGSWSLPCGTRPRATTPRPPAHLEHTRFSHSQVSQSKPVRHPAPQVTTPTAHQWAPPPVRALAARVGVASAPAPTQEGPEAAGEQTQAWRM